MAAPTVVGASSDRALTSGTSATITFPAHVANDLLIAVIVLVDSAPTDVPAPSGWTRLMHDSATGHGPQRTCIFARFATGSGTTCALSWSGASWWRRSSIVVRGAHNAHGVSGAISAADYKMSTLTAWSSAAQSLPSNSISPDRAENLLLSLPTVYTNLVSVRTWGAPSGMTHRTDSALSSSSTIGTAIFTQDNVGAGATGSKSPTVDNLSDSQASAYASPLIAISSLPPNFRPNAPAVNSPSDNETVALTQGVDFSWTPSDPESDPQAGWALKRRKVNLPTELGGGFQYGPEEWWNNSSGQWSTFPSTNAGSSTSVTVSAWDNDTDTYQYAIATADAIGVGAYSDWRTLNPWEFYDEDTQTWVPMVEQVNTGAEATLVWPTPVDKGTYLWSAATQDDLSAGGPYAAALLLLAGGSFERWGMAMI